MTAVEYHLFKFYEKTKSLLKKYFKNRYLSILLLFFVWMIFFDNDSFYRQIQRKWQIYKINKEIVYYQKLLHETKIEEKALNENDAYFEKFVREKYLLKRKNEDIFIFSNEP